MARYDFIREANCNIYSSVSCGCYLCYCLLLYCYKQKGAVMFAEMSKEAFLVFGLVCVIGLIFAVVGPEMWETYKHKRTKHKKKE